MSHILPDSPKQLKRRLQILLHLTYRRQIPASVAVVRSTPYRCDVLVLEVVFVAFVDELVGSGDEGEVVYVAEFVRYFVAEEPACIEFLVSGGFLYIEVIGSEGENEPAPLGLTAQVSTSSGSDQTRSQNAPS